MNEIDYPFGVLNPLSEGYTANRVDSQSSKHFFNASRALINNSSKVNALKGAGPFRAIVLKVEEKTSFKQLFVENPSEDDQEELELVRIRARIPELHSSIEPPRDFEDGVAIDLHPIFVAQSDLVPEPSPGEIVWVDFQSKRTHAGGIYIRPVAEKSKWAEAFDISVSTQTTYNSGEATTSSVRIGERKEYRPNEALPNDRDTKSLADIPPDKKCSDYKRYDRNKIEWYFFGSLNSCRSNYKSGVGGVCPPPNIARDFTTNKVNEASKCGLKIIFTKGLSTQMREELKRLLEEANIRGTGLDGKEYPRGWTYLNLNGIIYLAELHWHPVAVATGKKGPEVAFDVLYWKGNTVE